MTTPRRDGPAEMERLTRDFHAFVDRFRRGSAEDLANIELKVEHTFKVLDEARSLTQALDPGPDLTFQAQAAALFHDLGRFPQYDQYKTFRDALSANHARLGAKALARERLLAGLPQAFRRTILGAVFLHNVRFLPGKLSPALDFCTRVVRDSDKLDIYRVMLAHFEPGAPHNSVVVLGARPDTDGYTKSLTDQIRARRIAGYEQMANVNDFKLVLVSWVYDLNFAHSRKVLAARGQVERLFELLPAEPELAELRAQVLSDLQG